MPSYWAKAHRSARAMGGSAPSNLGTLQSPQIKSVDMKAFDYACGTALKMFDINARDSGDVTAKFTDYTRKANRDLIERSFNGTSFLKNVTAMERFYMASYPESFKCS